MHTNALYKEHNYTCGKLPFGVYGAHNTFSQIGTYDTSNHAFESCLILNVPQLNQNRGYVLVYSNSFFNLFTLNKFYLIKLMWYILACYMIIIWYNGIGLTLPVYSLDIYRLIANWTLIRKRNFLMFDLKTKKNPTIQSQCLLTKFRKEKIQKKEGNECRK